MYLASTWYLFLKGLSELILDIEELIYLSLDKICKDFLFINLSTNALNYFIRYDNDWLAKAKGKQIILIAARKSEALANYWYYNGDIRGVVYVDLARDIRKDLAYVINGRFLRKDIKKEKLLTGKWRWSEWRPRECIRNLSPELKIAVWKLFIPIGEMLRPSCIQNL